MPRMRLDFTNKALEDWIKLCPFPITVQQAVTQPKACKHITIDVTIEASKTKPNPDFVASDQQQFLELKYIEVDKKLNFIENFKNPSGSKIFSFHEYSLKKRIFKIRARKMPLQA